MIFTHVNIFTWVVFQRNANVLTNTPEEYENLYKMFIRWERSNVRENIMMSKFAFGDFRQGNKTGTRILLLNQWLKVILAYPRSEEHTSELQSRPHLVCRLLLEK